MKTIPDPPRLSTFKRRGGVRNRISSFLRLRFQRLDQRRQGSHVLLSCPVFNPVWALLPSFHIFLFTFPLLPCVIYPLPLFGPGGPSPFPLSSHRLPRIPLLFHVSLSPKNESITPHLPPLPPGLFHHGSSPLSLSLCITRLPRLSTCNPRCHHFYHTPPCPLRLAFMSRPSSYSVVPGGSVRSLPYPEVLSWPGRSQSQEAVIEAVEGG
jgi:hypothetical protein